MRGKCNGKQVAIDKKEQARNAVGEKHDFVSLREDGRKKNTQRTSEAAGHDDHDDAADDCNVDDHHDDNVSVDADFDDDDDQDDDIDDNDGNGDDDGW